MLPADAARARLAVTAVVRELGLEVHEVHDLNDSNRLTVHLQPCDLVARIEPVERSSAAAELERAAALVAAGAPVGAPDPRVPAEVQVRDGLEITLWVPHPPRTDRRLPPAEYAAVLVALHAAMRIADLSAPPLQDRVEAALCLVRDPSRTPRLTPEDRAFLRGTLERSGALVGGHPAAQLLHGEPHPGNVLDAADGPVLVDLETCLVGPVEFDLAHAPDEVAAHYPGADPALLEECRILSLALATTWRFDRDDSLPDGRRIGVDWLARLRGLVG